MSTVKVATYNAGGGEPVGPTDSDISNIIAKMLEAEVKVLMGQEFQEKHDRLILRESGFEVNRYGRECIIAWDPMALTFLSDADHTLNKTPYYRKGDNTPVFCRAPSVILGNTLGLTATFVSVHLPSHVQVRNPPERRIYASRQSVRYLSDLNEVSRTHGFCVGGDFNIDPKGSFQERFAYLDKNKTGLDLLYPPSNTLGRRRVDYFLTDGFTPTFEGKVLKGATHHNMHIQDLEFTP